MITKHFVDVRSQQYMTQALIQIQRDDVERMPFVAVYGGSESSQIQTKIS